MNAATVIDAIKTLGFPIVAALGLGYVIFLLARWGMRTGDRLAARFESHVDKLDASQDEIRPQLDRIETAVKTNVCRAPGFPPQIRGEPAASH